jgi:mycothiol system anti-sigma-R factor
MSAGDVVFAIATGLAANECCELTPWCSRKLARWSAYRRYTDPARAQARAEELAAVINDRPGNLLKLTTALTFAGGAAIVSTRRSITGRTKGSHPVQETAAAPTTARAQHELPHGEVLARVYSYLDGGLGDDGRAEIRRHLDECGPCLREYGLEEAVKRLTRESCGHNAVPEGLRIKVLTRIQEVRATLPPGN